MVFRGQMQHGILMDKKYGYSFSYPSLISMETVENSTAPYL